MPLSVQASLSGVVQCGIHAWGSSLDVATQERWAPVRSGGWRRPASCPPPQRRRAGRRPRRRRPRQPLGGGVHGCAVAHSPQGVQAAHCAQLSQSWRACRPLTGRGSRRGSWGACGRAARPHSRNFSGLEGSRGLGVVRIQGAKGTIWQWDSGAGCSAGARWMERGLGWRGPRAGRARSGSGAEGKGGREHGCEAAGCGSTQRRRRRQAAAAAAAAAARPRPHTCAVRALYSCHSGRSP